MQKHEVFTGGAKVLLTPWAAACAAALLTLSLLQRISLKSFNQFINNTCTNNVVDPKLFVTDLAFPSGTNVSISLSCRILYRSRC
jgi:hypothetical protein